MCSLVLKDMVGEDPWERHLNGKLDALTHSQLKIELSEPELGEVTAFTKGGCRTK